MLQSASSRSSQQRADRRTRPRVPEYSLAGVAGALVFGCASFTPSLAPRDWMWQGIVNGFSAAVGYGVGVALGRLAVAVTRRRPSPELRRRLWVAILLAGTPLVAVSLWLGRRWQRDIHLLMEIPPPESSAWVRTLAVAVLVFVLVVAVARALRRVTRRVSGWLTPLVPEPLAGPLAFLIVVLLLIGLNNGLLWRGILLMANSGFSAANSATDEGTVRATEPERSGSPASLISWESLGREGRNFVGQGPRASDLQGFSGEPAEEPVRVYAGLRSAGTTKERAALAVRELRRAGGFAREVLVVVTTTGTGYVDPAAAESVEYLYNGDTAIVGLQYSYFPSFLSLLVDSEMAEDAGRELFDQVHRAWSALPETRRPKLLVTGTSLGVFGSEAAFSGEADVRLRTDGVVWAGPPNFATLHRWFVENRDPGTPEWYPVYDQGRAVRFVPGAGVDVQLDDRDGEPEVVYLQNGSDPVVLWTPRLALFRPDWLSGPRAPDVSPDMFWIPVVTFWQVSADLPSNYDVPAGHGHRYLELYVDGWTAVARPEGWTEADSARLREELRRNQMERDRLAEASA
ncbi:MAG TPA: alpha/beta-hydrolase family protein [Nocardioidaceae bacterium]